MTESNGRRTNDPCGPRGSDSALRRPPAQLPPARRFPGDAIYESFSLIWATPREIVERESLGSLEKRSPSPEEFLTLVPAGSEEYTKFDCVLCAYDQAGALIKSGILHPAFFFKTWRSPTEIWTTAGPWVQAWRASRHSIHLYDIVDWLVAFERDWLKNAAP